MSNQSTTVAAYPPRAAEDEIVKIPMSLADYLRLPENPNNEWVRGVTLIMPPARAGHAAILGALIALLYNSLTGCLVLPDAGLRMPDSRRIPDIMLEGAGVGC